MFPMNVAVQFVNEHGWTIKDCLLRNQKSSRYVLRTIQFPNEHEPVIRDRKFPATTLTPALRFLSEHGDDTTACSQ